MIQLSLIDTFTLNASGGLVFSENYLYTLDAFREYFRHLKDDGIFVVTYRASSIASTDVIRAYLPNAATTPEATVTVPSR